ncbi:MAG: alpha/beta hydrolase, partial [Solirubrobacteraceae bacterium]
MKSGTEGWMESPMRAAMGALLYFPARELLESPRDAGLDFEELAIKTEDGERLLGWWVATRQPHSAAHVLFFHGNAGNIGDRVLLATLLTAVGFDVLLFDYRGYGLSTGKPNERGTYLDARAARGAMAAREDCEPAQVIYLGESLGAAVAAELAQSTPPRGLILQSPFTSLRDVARRHYPLPRFLIPDAYPTIRRIDSIDAPVLVLHGDRDAIVPVSHGRTLYEAAGQ